MGLSKIASRKLIIKEGMTPQYVKDYTGEFEATPQQKILAYIFDSDGVPGYSQREADVFNATTITCRGKEGFSLWTTYQDGTKKETRVPLGDIASFKYAPQGKVIRSSDCYFQNPKNTVTEIFPEPHQDGNTQREPYVRRTEKYPGGGYKTVMHKHIYKHLNKSRIVIVKYTENGNELERHDFYTDNMQLNTMI